MISVVIPAYQAEKYISDAIQSARAQTLAPSEVIVVDDGSTDRTAKVARACGAKVISQENGGVARARNVGIKAAQSPWLALLDADDLWESEKLESQWAALSRFSQAAFATCDNSFFDAYKTDTETYLDRLGQDYFRAGRREVEPGIALFERVNFIGLNWIIPSPSALLVNKEVFSTIGYFDEELNGVDDTEFYLRAMGRFPFLFVEKPLVKYRQGVGGQGGNHLLCGASFLKTIERISSKPHLYPPGVYESALAVKADRMALYGKALLRVGRFNEARRMLLESCKMKPKPLTLSLWLAARAGIKV